MSGHEPLPQDLEHVAEMLRDGRDEATPFELDRIKLRVMAQDARFSARTTGGLVKSRLAIMLALVLGLALSGTGATLAVTGGSGSGTDAASKEYKGCVDKHGHAKKCKKPHKTCADKKPADQAKCQQKDQQNFDKKHSDWQKKRDNC